MSAVAITLATTASSTNPNSGNRQEIKKLQCEMLVPKFNNTTATIEQKQKYADCIEVLHPVNTAGEVLFFKFLIILAFISFGVGFYKSKELDGTGMAIALGLLVSVLVPLVVFLVVAGIMFVFCGG